MDNQDYRISSEQISRYLRHLLAQERSAATGSKYARDIGRLARSLQGGR